MLMRKFVPLFMLLLLMGTAAAVCDYNVEIQPVTFTKSEYTQACIVYEWSHSRPNSSDFNNYIIRAEGSTTLDDMNYTAKTYTLCTVEPGTTVTFYVQVFEGSDTGHYCGFDYNVTTTTAGYIGVAKFMVYTLFTVMAAFIGVIIFVTVAVWGIKKMKIPIPFMKG